MDTHNNAMMKVPMPVSMVVVEAAVVSLGAYGAMGPCKRMVMEYCGNGNHNIRLLTIEEAVVELEKYVDTSDHNTNLPNMLHLGNLPQTAG